MVTAVLPVPTATATVTVTATAGTSAVWRAVRVILGMAKAAVPAVAIGTLIPLGLFVLILSLASVEVAVATSVAYTYGVGAYQYLRHARIAGVVLMAGFMVTVRAVAMLASGHTFAFFVVPVLETAGFGLLFVVTLWTREPLIVRLARDFVPQLAGELAGHRLLIRWLSSVWAGVYLASGTTTLVLLLTQPLPVYLLAHEVAGWAWVGSGIGATVCVVRWRAAGLWRAVLRPTCGRDVQSTSA